MKKRLKKKRTAVNPEIEWPEQELLIKTLGAFYDKDLHAFETPNIRDLIDISTGMTEAVLKHLMEEMGKNPQYLRANATKLFALAKWDMHHNISLP